MRQRLLSRSHIQPGGYLQLFPCCSFSSFFFFCFLPFCLPYVADSRPFCLLKHTLTRPLESWLFVRAQGQHLKGRILNYSHCVQFTVLMIDLLLMLLFPFYDIHRSKPCLAVIPWKSPEDRLNFSSEDKPDDQVKPITPLSHPLPPPQKKENSGCHSCDTTKIYLKCSRSIQPFCRCTCIQGCQ